MRARVERARRILQVLGREVLVAEAHARVAVAQHGHDGALRDAGHRQRRRRVVPQIVEVQVLEGQVSSARRAYAAPSPVLGSRLCPVWQKVDLTGRQTACSAACRRERTRQRETAARQARDREIRALLETALKKLQEGVVQ